MIKEDELQMLEVSLRILKFVFDVEFENTFRIISDAAHVGVL